MERRKFPEEKCQVDLLHFFHRTNQLLWSCFYLLLEVLQAELVNLLCKLRQYVHSIVKIVDRFLNVGELLVQVFFWFLFDSKNIIFQLDCFRDYPGDVCAVSRQMILEIIHRHLLGLFLLTTIPV